MLAASLGVLFPSSDYIFHTLFVVVFPAALSRAKLLANQPQEPFHFLHSSTSCMSTSPPPTPLNQDSDMTLEASDKCLWPNWGFVHHYISHFRSPISKPVFDP